MDLKKKKCKECDNIFTQYNSLDKYCSFKCQSLGKMVGDKKEVLVKCKECKKNFKPYKTTDKYCGVVCANKKVVKKKVYNSTIKKTRVVDDPLFIKNKASLIKEMFDDHGYLFCEVCKCSNGGLEGHHIIFRSEKPKHKNLHDKVNLIMCCVSCHNKFHRKKGVRNDLVIERGLEVVFGMDVLNK